MAGAAVTRWAGRTGLLLLLLGGSRVVAEDVSPPIGSWSQFGGSQGRNMVSGERGLPDHFKPGARVPGQQTLDLSEAENVAWAVRLGTQTFSSPSIADGRLLVGTNCPGNDGRFKGDRGSVMCFDARTGAFRWQVCMHTNPAHHELTRNLGVCSTPTLDGDRAWCSDARCNVLCLDLKGMADGNDGPCTDEAVYLADPGRPPLELKTTDGDIVWHHDVVAQQGVTVQDTFACSPLLVGDLVFAHTGNGVLIKDHTTVPAPLAPSLIALDRRSGELVAQDAERMGTRLFHGTWSSPSYAVVAGRPMVLFGGSDGICYAFAPVPERDPGGRIATLKKLWSFDCNRGIKGPYRKNRQGPSEIIGTPVCWHDRVYVATGQDWLHGSGRGRLSCIDATRDGDVTDSGRVWSYDTIDRSVGTVSIADGLLYIADVGGKLHCLDAETGAVQWVDDLKAQCWGNTLVADGKVYVGNCRGRIFIYAAGREKRLLSTTNLNDPLCGGPVAAQGMVYIATYSMLYALKDGIPAKGAGTQTPR